MTSSSSMVRALYSICGLLTAVILCSLGLFLVLLPFVDAFKLHIFHLVIENPYFLMKMGCAFLCVATLLTWGMYRSTRKKFFHLSLECSSIAVEEAIIKDYVDRYWKEIFPDRSIDSTIALHPRNRLEVIAKIPDIPMEERQDVFQRIQNELGVILARKIGYEKEFFLTVTD